LGSNFNFTLFYLKNLESDYLHDQVDGGIENEEERGNKATTPVPVPKRPFGVEVPGWDGTRRYTLHSDESAKKNLLSSPSREMKEALHQVVIAYLDSLKNHPVHFSRNDGHAGKLAGKKTDIVRLDYQQIDGKVGERQYANLQIQVNENKISGKGTTTLAILHVELDKDFDHAHFEEAFIFGLEHRVGVWLSARPNQG